MGKTSIGIGISGNSCVEYNHLMGIYNKLIPDVTTNVVVIADLSDILPPKGKTDFKSLRPTYPFRKVEGRLGEISYKFRLMAFRNLLKKVATAWHKKLDLRGNHWIDHDGKDMLEESTDTSNYEEYWHTMLQALTAKAPNGRLMIVLAPIVPQIRDGGVSFLMDKDDANTITRFKQVCMEYNLIGGGAIDISDRLCEYQRETRKFPRGFFNTIPGKGHFCLSAFLYG